MKHYVVGLLLSVLVLTSSIVASETPKETIESTQTSNPSYFSRIGSGAYDLFNRLNVPGNYINYLNANYFNILEERTAKMIAAQKRISELESEKLEIMKKGITLVPQKRLNEIENEIYEQKIIAGQLWSTQKKIILGTLALMGTAAIGFGAYKYFQQPSDLARIPASVTTPSVEQSGIASGFGGITYNQEELKNTAFEDDNFKNGELDNKNEEIKENPQEFTRAKRLSNTKLRQKRKWNI